MTKVKYPFSRLGRYLGVPVAGTEDAVTCKGVSTEVLLVTNDNNLRTGRVLEDTLYPRVDHGVAVHVGEVEDNKRNVCVSKIAADHALVPFLSGSVPYHDAGITNCHLGERGTDSRYVGIAESLT